MSIINTASSYVTESFTKLSSGSRNYTSEKVLFNSSFDPAVPTPGYFQFFFPYLLFIAIRALTIILVYRGISPFLSPISTHPSGT